MLGRWDPFAELSRIQDDFARVAGTARRNGGHAFTPAVNIYQGKDAILVNVEVPGVRSEDVQIGVENNVLTVSGERRLPKEDEGWQRVESVYGTFSRSFALPSTVDSAGIEASMDAGILTVRVPRRAETQPRKIKVTTPTEKAAVVPAVTSASAS
jgi:HSP20 family protein